MCRYSMEWQSGDAPYATSCTIDEPTWPGHTDCARNAQTSFDDVLLQMPTSPCAGFDDTGQAHNIFKLVAGEGDQGLQGMIQFTAASTNLRGFLALGP